ncbi:MAG: alpha/beta hydrolase [Anaerolineaceae bacterium]|nr:alpha/beta hydrolase [Anaerolineaceae bacterium]
MISWITGSCEANGVQIHYRRTGGDKPPLLLLHGLLGNGACWTPLARALERDYDVVMPDARGHGRSSAPLHGYRYEDHAGDVIALIQRLELSAPILLGHSMGGMTAAVVASRAAPLIRGVVLADPTFLSLQRQRDVCDSDVAEQHRRLLSQDQAEVLAQLRSRHTRRSPELVELIASARLQTRLSAFDVLIPPNPDYHRLVRAIAVPILLVIGDAGVVSLETARELQRLNSHLRVELVPDAGHGVHYDQPERFQAVVQPFLRSVVAASPSASSSPNEYPVPLAEDYLLHDLVWRQNALPMTALAQEVGLFERLQDQPATIEAVAALLDVTARAAEMMVAVAAALGFLEALGDGRFGLTAVGRTYLLPSSPFAYGPFLSADHPTLDKLRRAFLAGEPSQPFAVNMENLSIV